MFSWRRRIFYKKRTKIVFFSLRRIFYKKTLIWKNIFSMEKMRTLFMLIWNISFFLSSKWRWSTLRLNLPPSSPFLAFPFSLNLTLLFLNFLVLCCRILYRLLCEAFTSTLLLLCSLFLVFLLSFFIHLSPSLFWSFFSLSSFIFPLVLLFKKVCMEGNAVSHIM